MTGTLHDAAVLALTVPPVTGTQPPGTGSVTTILGWVFWCVAAVLMGGWMIGVAGFARSGRRGERGEAVEGLGWVLVGAIALAAGGAILQAV